MMKAKCKKSYLVPKCIIVRVDETTNLLTASFPGQHNPGHHATGPASAKKAFSWETTSDDDDQFSSSEDN